MNAREAAGAQFPAFHPDDEEVTYTRGVLREAVRKAFVPGWDAALEQARNEIPDVTVTIDGTEFVFAEDVRHDLDALEKKEES